MNSTDDHFIVEQMIKQMPLAAYAADENWKILFLNKAAEDLTGISASEAVGMRVRDIFKGTLGKKGCPVFDAINMGTVG